MDSDSDLENHPIDPYGGLIQNGTTKSDSEIAETKHIGIVKISDPYSEEIKRKYCDAFETHFISVILSKKNTVFSKKYLEKILLNLYIIINPKYSYYLKLTKKKSEFRENTLLSIYDILKNYFNTRVIQSGILLKYVYSNFKKYEIDAWIVLLFDIELKDIETPNKEGKLITILTMAIEDNKFDLVELFVQYNVCAVTRYDYEILSKKPIYIYNRTLVFLFLDILASREKLEEECLSAIDANSTEFKSIKKQINNLINSGVKDNDYTHSILLILIKKRDKTNYESIDELIEYLLENKVSSVTVNHTIEYRKKQKLTKDAEGNKKTKYDENLNNLYANLPLTTHNVNMVESNHLTDAVAVPNIDANSKTQSVKKRTKRTLKDYLTKFLTTKRKIVPNASANNAVVVNPLLRSIPDASRPEYNLTPENLVRSSLNGGKKRTKNNNKKQNHNGIRKHKTQRMLLSNTRVHNASLNIRV
jgi:hypothetical protein